jgi:hypothetical protein
MHHIHDDGGRSNAGWQGTAGDCVCRSIAIASGRPYQEVYDRLAEGNATQRRSKRMRKAGRRSARNGIYVKAKWFKDYMRELGATWWPTCQIGLGAAPISTLPQTGRLVVSFRKHYSAMIDGVLHDTWDATYGYDRRVYGYWKF